MKCPKCNYNNGGGAKACMLCGEELSGAGAELGTQVTQVIGDPRRVTELFLHSFTRDPIKVTAERPATIGRVDGNDIVLPAKVVSRRHARVEWRDGSFYAVDLGSSNGTYVNDQKVSAAEVGPGDEIRIGSFNIRCLESQVEEDEDDQDASATMVVAPGSGSASGFSGKLEEMGLGEVLTIIEMTRKTGTVVLNLKAGVAKIYFKDGQIINAEGCGRKAEEAFFEIFRNTEGTFDFEQGTPLVKKVIDMPTTSLLLEAARQSDEAGR